MHGRISEQIEKSVHISDNVIGGDNNESKSTTLEVTANNSSSTHLNPDQKLDTSHDPLNKQDSLVTIHEINKKQLVHHADTNFNEHLTSSVHKDNDEFELNTTLESNQNNTILPKHSLGEKAEETESELKLTRFIKEGLLKKARNASEVDSTMFMGIKSYSGFLTVDEQYDSNTFFWYFPVEGKTVQDAPWIIWLQGGPGSSSLYAVFHEMGPFAVHKEGFLKSKKYLMYNIVFVFGTAKVYQMFIV